MKQIIEWVFGDWSNDGHGQMRTFVAEVEYDESFYSFNEEHSIIDEMKNIERRVPIELGFDLINNYTSYEDNVFTDEQKQTLKNIGISFKDKSIMTEDEYAKNWVQLFNKISDKFQLKLLKVPCFVAEGGYGLFSI
jgi:hypothetical protein